MTNVLVLFHSVTGATFKLAEVLAEGVDQEAGCTAVLKRIPDIGGADVIFGGQDMSGPKSSFQHVPEATVKELLDHDALVDLALDELVDRDALVDLALDKLVLVRPWRPTANL